MSQIAEARKITRAKITTFTVVTTTSHFQIIHFSTVKFYIVIRKLWTFLQYQNLPEFEKKKSWKNWK